MSEEHQTTAATGEAIETDFGGRWGAWLSDTGRWWAARTDALTSAQLNAGCVPFIQADTPSQTPDPSQTPNRYEPASSRPASYAWPSTCSRETCP